MTSMIFFFDKIPNDKYMVKYNSENISNNISDMMCPSQAPDYAGCDSP